MGAFLGIQEQHQVDEAWNQVVHSSPGTDYVDNYQD
jgi:hypothetical protein